MEIKIFNEVMEWGLNGVPLKEIIKRLEENYKIIITEEELINLIKKD